MKILLFLNIIINTVLDTILLFYKFTTNYKVYFLPYEFEFIVITKNRMISEG